MIAQSTADAARSQESKPVRVSRGQNPLTRIPYELGCSLRPGECKHAFLGHDTDVIFMVALNRSQGSYDPHISPQKDFMRALPSTSPCGRSTTLVISRNQQENFICFLASFLVLIQKSACLILWWLENGDDFGHAPGWGPAAPRTPSWGSYALLPRGSLKVSPGENLPKRVPNSPK